MPNALLPFQFTRPQEARRKILTNTTNLATFQFTRPQEARPLIGIFVLLMVMFQFTRPQEARQARRGGSCTRPRVSIHAPARGATGRLPCLLFAVPPFQFTRPQEARPFCRRADAYCHRFNSRARKRRDRAGAHGARRTRCFNSRARKRRDVLL